MEAGKRQRIREGELSLESGEKASQGFWREEEQAEETNSAH